MTWSARIEHTPAGLALTFGAPLSRLDMSADVAAHLASLLAVEARHRLAGVVSTLVAENACTSAVRMRPKPKTSQTHPNTELAENKQFYVGQNLAHALQCDCDLCLNGDQHA
jgi:hypothetical protein